MHDGAEVKWTIGIPTVPARRMLLGRLLALLEPQIQKYPDIELLVLEDNRKRELGPKRQAIINMAQGKYINFIDDDDIISEHYIDTIYPLLNGVDCVGFTGQISIEQGPWLNVYYSKDNGWETVEDGYLRPPQHLTPVKTELALQIPYRGHRHEDSDWSERMKEADLLKTENKTPEILYYYYATSQYNRVGVWE